MSERVRRITAEETIDVRHAVLRAGLPRESAIFPGDEAEETRHFGAFDGGKLVGVASIYVAPLPEESSSYSYSSSPSVDLPPISVTPLPDPRAAADAWQLRGMATLPEVRRRGIGGALLSAALAEVAAAGAPLLWCNARIGAVPFYKKHGFRVLGGEFDIPTAGPHFRMCIELPRSVG